MFVVYFGAVLASVPLRGGSDVCVWRVWVFLKHMRGVVVVRSQMYSFRWEYWV